MGPCGLFLYDFWTKNSFTILNDYKNKLKPNQNRRELQKLKCLLYDSWQEKFVGPYSIWHLFHSLKANMPVG